MCVRFRKQDLTGRDFKAGWDLIGYPSASFQTLLRYTPIKCSECAAAFELFSKDNAEQLLGIAELDLVLRSLGQVNCVFISFTGEHPIHKMSFSSTRPFVFFLSGETAVLLFACFRTTTPFQMGLPIWVAPLLERERDEMFKFEQTHFITSLVPP